MGLAIPRPSKVTRKEAKTISAQLQEHLRRMKEYTDRDVDPKTASAAALQDMRAK